MGDRSSGGAYRDELAAAQARVQALEEELSARDAEARRTLGVEEADPVLGGLLEKRRALERARRSPRNWRTYFTALILVTMPLIPVITLRRVNVERIEILAVISMLVALLLVWKWPRVIEWGNRERTLALDAKIAEARRMRAIEERLSEQSQRKRRARVRVKTDPARIEAGLAEEASLEEEESDARASRRGKRS